MSEPHARKFTRSMLDKMCDGSQERPHVTGISRREWSKMREHRPLDPKTRVDDPDYDECPHCGEVLDKGVCPECGYDSWAPPGERAWERRMEEADRDYEDARDALLHAGDVERKRRKEAGDG